LPIHTQANIAAFIIVIIIIYYDICAALKRIFGEIFNGRQFFLGYLSNKFAQLYAALRSIGIKIGRLVKLPNELFMLNPVFPKLHRINLRKRK